MNRFLPIAASGGLLLLLGCTTYSYVQLFVPENPIVPEGRGTLAEYAGCLPATISSEAIFARREFYWGTADLSGDIYRNDLFVGPIVPVIPFLLMTGVKNDVDPLRLFLSISVRDFPTTLDLRRILLRLPERPNTIAPRNIYQVVDGRFEEPAMPIRFDAATKTTFVLDYWGVYRIEGGVPAEIVLEVDELSPSNGSEGGSKSVRLLSHTEMAICHP